VAVHILNWYLGLQFRCLCGHCQAMNTTRLQFKVDCCKEIEEIQNLLVGDPLPTCITVHPEFANTCLSRTVLTIAFHGYRHHYGTSDVPSDENRYINKQ